MSGKGEITIIITENGSHVIIDFNDSGKGIKNQNLKLFLNLVLQPNNEGGEWVFHWPSVL